MFSRSTARSVRARGIFRVAALVLLLIAVGDLAFPQICGEDNGPLFPAQQAAASGHADESGAPLPHQAPAEDCFCCCSHIMSEDSASPLDQLALVTRSERIAVPAVPLAPVQVLFHPPRLG